MPYTTTDPLSPEDVELEDDSNSDIFDKVDTAAKRKGAGQASKPGVMGQPVTQNDPAVVWDEPALPANAKRNAPPVPAAKSTPAKVDYDALARQAGAISSAPSSTAKPAPASLAGSPNDIAARALAQQGLPPAATPTPPKLRVNPNLPPESQGPTKYLVSGGTPLLQTAGEAAQFDQDQNAPKPTPGQMLKAGAATILEGAPNDAGPAGSGFPLAQGIPSLVRGAANIAGAQNRQDVYKGGAQLIGGALDELAPAFAAGLIEKPIQVGAGLISGVLTAKGAQLATQAAGGSKEAQNLAEAAGFAIPSIIGLNIEASDVPGSRGAIVSGLGGKVAVGAAEAPEGGVAVGARFGGKRAGTVIGAPEAEATRPGIEPQTIKGEPGAVSRGDVIDRTAPQAATARTAAVGAPQAQETPAPPKPEVETPAAPAVTTIPEIQTPHEVIAHNAEDGLPIVRLDSPAVAPRTPESVSPSPRRVPENVASGAPRVQQPRQESTVGATEPETGRTITQPTDKLSKAQELATAAAPELKQKLDHVTSGIDGAKVVGLRDTKDADRAKEKATQEGKPVETLPDLLAARISVDSPAARDQVVAELKKQFPGVVREDDQFSKGDPEFGFRAHTLQFPMSNGSTAEVQVLPKEQADIVEKTHDKYQQAREADIAGNTEKHAQLAAELKATHDAAMQKFEERTGAATAPSPSGIRAERNPSTPTPAKPPSATPADPVTVEVDGKHRHGTITYLSKRPFEVSRVKLDNGTEITVPHSQVARRIEPSTNGVAKGVTSNVGGAQSGAADGAIAVGLDNTLAKYDGYKGPTDIGAPIPSMVKKVRQLLADGKEVWIYTSRAENPQSVAAIKAWTKEHIGKELPVTNLKHPGFAEFYDDRMVRPRHVGPEATPGTKPTVNETTVGAKHGNDEIVTPKGKEEAEKRSSPAPELKARIEKATTPSEPAAKQEPSSGQGVTFRSSLFGAEIAAEKAIKVIGQIDKAYDRVTDAALQKLHMGRAYPEVEREDPQVAADLRELAAAPQYYRAKADADIRRITKGMTRQQEKGFVLLADKDSREWLRENKPDEYRGYMRDDRITQALSDYKPMDAALTDKTRALGGATTEGDHMRRVYADHVAGIDKGTAMGDRLKAVSYDRVITPQMADKKARSASPEYYYQHGLHEFGPSYATRFMSINMRLAEHRAAIHFLSNATKIENKDGLPETIEYNGKTYFRPDVARLVKEAASDSQEGKEIAELLGLTQLPKPSSVKEYAVYDPTPADKSDFQAKKLAQKLEEAHQNASGTKLRPEDMDELLKQAASINHSNHPLYAGPKEIVDAFNSGAKHVIRGWLRTAGEIINPISSMTRRQIIGLGFGVPHIKNILRRVMQASPGAHLDPRSYARAAKVLLSDELRQRGVKGVDDPSFDALLKHAGISDRGIESYRDYVESNTDAGRMERAWHVIKASGADFKSFQKQWLQDIKAAHNEGGFKGNAKAATTALAGAIETPLRPLMFMGHHAIFGPGGIDQKSRLWLYDLIKSQEPGITDDQMAQRINDQLGRYNKASWTDFQKDAQPFTFFPGWDYSSTAWVLRHPLRGTVPAALLVLLANQVLNHYGKNKHKDSTDLSRVHYRRYSISDNIFNERLGKALVGSGMRFASSKLRSKRNEEALRDALAGTPSDARAFTGMLNPFAAIPLELSFGKELGTGEDIVPDKDKRHAGTPEKDWAWYAAHKALPAYSELAKPKQGETPVTFALHNVGTSVYRGTKRKH